LTDQNNFIASANGISIDLDAGKDSLAMQKGK
jgi:hypothetical protein